MSHRKLNAILAAAVFFIAWIVYFMTKAPTLSFWDCGEFVACSYSLGVPHPPGTPLFVILGKFVSMLLFFVQDKAVRITLISSTGGAFTAMFVYLMAVRFLISGFGLSEDFWKRFSIYAGGIISGLCTAFAATIWFNHVESEVYGANVALMVLTNWLIIRWADARKEAGSDRFIVLIVFVAFLNIGLHVQSLLVLPSFFLFVVLMDQEKLRDWRFWTIGVVLFMQAMAVSTFLWLAPVALVATLFAMLFAGGGEKSKWRLAFFMVMVGLVGYSVHLYIPIRSAQNPIIDENDPETWAKFKYFLERKQYGNESMVKQSFTRKGTFRGQFWDGTNMGYGLYHLKQFHWTIKPFDFGKPQDLARLLIYLLPSLVMFYGMWEMYKRDRNATLMYIALFVTTSLGLIWYMNFKDGSNPEFPREVRERDYFFTPGFLYYMFWVGIGASALMQKLLSDPREIVRKVLGPAVALALLCTPAIPLAANYRTHDRTGNYVPWDYSYNLLMSCEKDGILFTNGDNDTFPVWALQEVYGIRRDVRIVNLSLLNTDWYIEQLKTLDPKVPISFSLDEISRLEHQRNPFEKDVRYKVGGTGMEVTLPGRERAQILRIQDIMVMNIVETTNWRKPVYFAVTVSDDNRMGLDPYLSMEGLVFKITPNATQGGRIDIDKTIDNLLHVYRYRGLGDGSCYMDDDTRRLLTNYTAGFIGAAWEERRNLDALRQKYLASKSEADSAAVRKRKDAQEKQLLAAAVNEEYQRRLDRTADLLKKSSSLVPDDFRPRMLLSQLLLDHERYAEAEAVVLQGIKVDPQRQEYRAQLAMAQEKSGKKADAIRSYREAIRLNPDNYNAYVSMATMFKELGRMDSARLTFEEWMRRHPGDRRAQTAMEALKKDS